MANTVLITGASRGIGAATARYFGEQGWQVAVHYHEREDLALELVRELREMGTCAVALGADLACPDQASALPARAEEALATLDALVCGAGIALPQGGMAMTEPPSAQATSSPQGRVSRTMVRKRRKGMSVSPARMQIKSSGKKGNRKTRARKTSRFRRMTSRYLSATVRLTRRSAKFCPRARASQNTNTDPMVIAATVSRNAGHIPKSTAPARAVILLGIGARMTERSCTTKKSR